MCVTDRDIGAGLPDTARKQPHARRVPARAKYHIKNTLKHE